MRKFPLLLTFVVVLIFLSCGSTPTVGTGTGTSTAPATTPAPAPAPTPAPAPAPVITPTPPPPPPVQPASVSGQNFVNGIDLTGARRYTVEDGDSLNQIARRFYGGLTGVGLAGTNNGFYYPVLILASPQNNITDPDFILPGMELNIPDLSRNLANSSSREAIRNYLRQVANIYNRKGIEIEEEGLLRLANSL